jgi:hypothetical protein
MAMHPIYYVEFILNLKWDELHKFDHDNYKKLAAHGFKILFPPKNLEYEDFNDRNRDDDKKEEYFRNVLGITNKEFLKKYIDDSPKVK